MATLSSWQKITRVLPGMPFGDGREGAYSSASAPSLTVQSCSGTSGTNTLTLAVGAFANGDVIKIVQMRGTGVGQYEINKITSGGGTTSLTLDKNLQYTYTDSGASQAQVFKMLMYTSITVQAGTWNITGWDENTNGCLPLVARVGTTITGTINGDGLGFLGALGVTGTNEHGHQGEGTAATRGGSSEAANGNGAGGADDGNGGNRAAGGGGGGNALAGATGSNSPTGTTGGTGGEAKGSADLTNMVLGGGGGGGGSAVPTTTFGTDKGAGGDGGAIVVFFTKDITITGGITVDGANGTTGARDGCGGGGGGAGGSVLIVCQTATLGSSLITATGGVGAAEGGFPDGLIGGTGSVGRIAVHHSGTVTGTTSPAFTDVSDPTLIETNAGFIFNLL